MAARSKWVRCRMRCPEKRGDTTLFVQWDTEGKKEVLTRAYCDNPKLRDLSGKDCQWSCWDQLSKDIPSK